MAITEIGILKDLGFSKQLTFAYLTCKRFYPITASFIQEYKVGELAIFKDAVDTVYRSITETECFNTTLIEKLLFNMGKNIPGTNDFPNYHGTIAMYSGIIIYESINLLKKQEVDRILTDISDTAINIVDCYIQVRDDIDQNDKNLEEKILYDEAMTTELSLQKGIIVYLSKIDNVDLSDISTLIELQENKKRSFIL